MTHTYILVDTSNLAMRVRYGMRAPDMNATIGLAIHILFNSIKQVWKQFDATHTVFALEGRSWRKDFYQPYKANRRETAAARTPQEVEDDTLFFDALNDLITFLRDKTNATVLRNPQAEADDMIARFIALHPEDDHVIISTDSDFLQLLAPNVRIYNGIAGLLYTSTGVWDKDGNAAVNKRGELLGVPNPEWLLFEKCMRGDDSDNVMSAYPGVRKKKLQEAFENRHEQGFAWNNLMLSKWTDHMGHEIRVRDAYLRNKSLIDLHAQPEELRQLFDQTIQEAVSMPLHTQVGVNLIKFANSWGLVRIEQHVGDYSSCISKGYQGCLRK